MKHRHALILLTFTLTAVLAACARSSSPGSGAVPATTATAPAASAPASSPTATTPVTAGDLTAAATTQQEGADTGTSTDSGEASLEQVASLPPQAQLPAGNWSAGTNYTVLSPAQPIDEPPGKVQVVEVFWYACPHCYALDPFLESWLKSKPSYIDFVRVPVMWSDIHRAHARLFYTLEALGKVDQLHSKIFDEIQQQRDPLYVAGDPQATLAQQLKFAEANGISAANFTAAYNSFGVQTELQKADDLDRRYRVDGVPTIIVDGKYVTDVGRAGGDEQLIKLINDLAASEKRPAS